MRNGSYLEPMTTPLTEQERALRDIPPSPCDSQHCMTVKRRACEKSHNKGCFAFHEYVHSRKGEYNTDLVGRMRKGSY
jgi:hypothetical protein